MNIRYLWYTFGEFKSFYNFTYNSHQINLMLDTSYGFNNLLKEVSNIWPRDINTSPDLRKSSSRTLPPAKKSAPKSKGHLDPSVSPSTGKMLRGVVSYFYGIKSTGTALMTFLPFLNIFKLCRSQENGGQPYRQDLRHFRRRHHPQRSTSTPIQLEVQHPAAKMLVMACKMQEEECGDATNFVVTLAG